MISYEQMLAELQSFCDQSQTGTLLIATDQGASGKLGLVNGKIIGVTFTNQRGLKALDLLKTFAKFDISFWKGKPVVSNDADLPATSDIFTILHTEPAVNEVRQTQNQQSKVDSEQFNGLYISSSFRFPEADELTRILETELTRSIGPVASIYIERYQQQIRAVQSKNQLQDLLQSLAGKSANPDTAAEFCERVLNSLNI